MIRLLKETFSEFSEDGCARMAAALAYYSAFSLPPLLVVIVAAVGLFVDPQDLSKFLVSQMHEFLGPQAATQIRQMMSGANHGAGGLVSMGLLIIGATGLMVQLQSALNDTFEVAADPHQSAVRNFLWKRVLSFGLILAVAFLLIVSFILDAVLSAAGGFVANLLPGTLSGHAITGIHLGASWVIFTFLFAVLYRYLPDARIRWRHALPAGLLAATLFLAGKFGMAWYLGRQDYGSIYGAAGSIVLVLAWMYFSALVFLFAAEMTQVYLRLHGERIEPQAGAVRVHRELVREDEAHPH